MNLRSALRAGIVFGASAAACVALAQVYTVTSNDTVRLNSGGNGGSAVTPLFFSAVNTAVANDGAVNPCVTTHPSVKSGFGTNAVVVASGPNCAFSLNTDAASSNGVVALPAATDGWACAGADVTTSTNAVFTTKMTNETVNSVTLNPFASNGAATNWVANDIIVESCSPF